MTEKIIVWAIVWIGSLMICWLFSWVAINEFGFLEGRVTVPVYAVVLFVMSLVWSAIFTAIGRLRRRR